MLSNALFGKRLFCCFFRLVSPFLCCLATTTFTLFHSHRCLATHTKPKQTSNSCCLHRHTHPPSIPPSLPSNHPSHPFPVPLSLSNAQLAKQSQKHMMLTSSKRIFTRPTKGKKFLISINRWVAVDCMLSSSTVGCIQCC